MRQARLWRAFAFLFLVGAAVAPALHAAQLFVAIPQCRVVDTRLGGGGYFVPPFTTVRTYDILGTTDFSAAGSDQAGDASCAPIPTNATAVSFNFFAVGPEGARHLTAWAADQPQPSTSTINYSAAIDTGGLNIGNGVIVPVAP